MRLSRGAKVDALVQRASVRERIAEQVAKQSGVNASQVGVTFDMSGNATTLTITIAVDSGSEANAIKESLDTEIGSASSAQTLLSQAGLQHALLVDEPQIAIEGGPETGNIFGLSIDFLTSRTAPEYIAAAAGVALLLACCAAALVMCRRRRRRKSRRGGGGGKLFVNAYDQMPEHYGAVRALGGVGGGAQAYAVGRPPPGVVLSDGEIRDDSLASGKPAQQGSRKVAEERRRLYGGGVGEGSRKLLGSGSACSSSALGGKSTPSTKKLITSEL